MFKKTIVTSNSLNTLIRNIFLLSPFVFLFLQSFYIPKTNIPIYDIIIAIFFIIIIWKQRHYINLFKYNFFKILCLYILWVICSGAFLVAIEVYSFNYYLYSVFILFIFNNITWFLYPSIICPHYFSLKKLIKFILIAIYIVCLYGLLVYICNKINFTFINYINDIFVTRRDTNYFIRSRLSSFFEEPGYLGGFICINIPLIYEIILSKYKIIKNKYANYLFKKSYLPIIFITLILTKSPIWLCFATIISLAYFHKVITKNIKKIILYFLIIIVSLYSYLKISNFDISTTYLKRIQVVLENKHNLSDLILAEQSLGNRIVSYNIRYNLFKMYPITGIGYKNAEYNVSKGLKNNNLPLTLELKKLLSTQSKYIILNGSILWNSLSDTGAVGFILFYLFLLFCIFKINEIKSKLPENIDKNFIRGIQYSIITIILISFYDIRSNFTYLWFLFGLVICFIQHYKLVKDNTKIKNKLNIKSKGYVQ